MIAGAVAAWGWLALRLFMLLRAQALWRGAIGGAWDLVAAGLASCILTTMAMFAERNGLSLEGAKASVEKHMTTPPSPRRIGRLPVSVTLPASVPAEWRERVERAGRSCPVHASLHPDVDAPITFKYV